MSLYPVSYFLKGILKACRNTILLYYYNIINFVITPVYTKNMVFVAYDIMDI